MRELFTHACNSDNRVTWFGPVTRPFFLVSRPGCINKKRIKIVFVSFNTKFYGFIYWRQSQEYRIVLSYTIFTNARVGNIRGRIFIDVRVKIKIPIQIYFIVFYLVI
jgi:hypothetical protein